MIRLEVPASLRPVRDAAAKIADEVFRPLSRGYDRAEHRYPVELELVAAMIDGFSRGHQASSRGDSGSAIPPDEPRKPNAAPRPAPGEPDGASLLGTVLGTVELARGDVALLLSLPGKGLGNAAIAALGTPEQQARYGQRWAAMAITEPDAGSDAAAIRTRAVRDGEDYVLNGEKIFVTAGQRADLVVVWATLDPALGRRGIRAFIVERTNPGLKLVRLERKLGIRASDTASFALDDCRVGAHAMLGAPGYGQAAAGGDPSGDPAGGPGFAGAMQTFDNTRPLVAAMAVGVARAALERTTELLAEAGIRPDPDALPHTQSAAAARLLELRAEYEAAYLLTRRAAWMSDTGRPNSMEASMAKSKAGRAAVEITLACVQLCGASGYGEGELLEKWARDAKILDIFEGTQQIQLLIVARRLLGLSSTELR